MDFYLFGFYQVYDFEPNKDGGIIETSYDNGLTWTNLIYDPLIVDDDFEGPLYNIDDTIKACGNQPGYTGLRTHNPPGVYNFEWSGYELLGDTLLFRFSFYSDSNDAGNEGWMLDDFYFGGGLVPIDNIETSGGLLLYPNPVGDELKLLGETKEIAGYRITNIKGEVVGYEDTSIHKSIGVSGLKPGLYFLTVRTPKGELKTIKFRKL